MVASNALRGLGLLGVAVVAGCARHHVPTVAASPTVTDLVTVAPTSRPAKPGEIPADVAVRAARDFIRAHSLLVAGTPTVNLDDGRFGLAVWEVTIGDTRFDVVPSTAKVVGWSMADDPIVSSRPDDRPAPIDDAKVRAQLESLAQSYGLTSPFRFKSQHFLSHEGSTKGHTIVLAWLEPLAFGYPAPDNAMTLEFDAASNRLVSFTWDTRFVPAPPPAKPLSEREARAKADQQLGEGLRDFEAELRYVRTGLASDPEHEPVRLAWFLWSRHRPQSLRNGRRVFQAAIDAENGSLLFSGLGK